MRYRSVVRKALLPETLRTTAPAEYGEYRTVTLSVLNGAAIKCAITVSASTAVKYRQLLSSRVSRSRLEASALVYILVAIFNRSNRRKMTYAF